VTEEPLRQRGYKRVRGDGFRLLERAMGEVIQLRSAGPIAGEMEGDQALEARIGSEILPGEVEVLGDLPLMLDGARPVLTEECALMPQLPSIASREAHAMTGGEEEGRSVFPTKHPSQAVLLGVVAEEGLQLPTRLVRSDLIG
jgi:hypothetical protein